MVRVRVCVWCVNAWVGALSGFCKGNVCEGVGGCKGVEAR